jgi:hypothetical protein
MIERKKAPTGFADILTALQEHETVAVGFGLLAQQSDQFHGGGASGAGLFDQCASFCVGEWVIAGVLLLECTHHVSA